MIEQQQLESANRVLVVEDDRAVMNFFQALLVSRGYHVVPARNGVEAMVALTEPQDELPHAIILDLGLPLEGGLSVLTFLRTTLRSAIPVIIVTGRHDADEERSIRELGISAFLHKPVNTEQVLHALARAIG